MPPRLSTLTQSVRRYPVVTQLVILGMLLLAIFTPFLRDLMVTPAPSEATLATLPTTAPTNAALITLPQKINDVTITAKSAYVWDVANQRVLFSKNPDASLPLASLTKLMTTLVTTELIDPATTARVPQSAINQEGNSGLNAGEQISLSALSRLALIASSNDAAHALAATVGKSLGEGDETAQFVRAMNIRADELGLTSLQFKNATGLDISATEAGAVGTARDVTFLLEYVLKTYPEMLQITQDNETRVLNEAGQYHSAANTNPIIAKIPNLLASKTGYTDLAGGNLTIAYDAGFNRPIIITVLGSTREGRFEDVLTLLEAVNAAVAEAAI